MTDETFACPCGESGKWLLAEHDQFHPPFPPPGKLGEEVPIFVDHRDGTRHRVHHGQIVGQ